MKMINVGKARKGLRLKLKLMEEILHFPKNNGVYES